MTKRIYGTYRAKKYNTSVKFDTFSRNGYYNPGEFLDAQYEDYVQAGLTKTYDSIIPEENYIATMPCFNKDGTPVMINIAEKYMPEILVQKTTPKLTRFIMGEYIEPYVSEADYKANVEKVGADFQIDMFATPVEAIDWVKANTDLIETSPGVFLISEASSEMGIEQEAKYLTIN